MAAKSRSKPKPKWIIDLHGIKEALTSRSNARARVIDAIQSGEMLVMRSVQTELCAAYPDIWQDFVAIRGKKYQDTPMAVYDAAGQLQGMHGSSLLGGIPDLPISRPWRWRDRSSVSWFPRARRSAIARTSRASVAFPQAM